MPHSLRAKLSGMRYKGILEDKDYKRLCHALDLEKAEQERKWIPCSERMPEDEQEILFSTKTGRVHSGKYHDDDSANQWYSHRDKCRAWNNVVSAWMPLPKPYEPQESEE